MKRTFWDLLTDILEESEKLMPSDPWKMYYILCSDYQYSRNQKAKYQGKRNKYNW